MNRARATVCAVLALLTVSMAWTAAPAAAGQDGDGFAFFGAYDLSGDRYDGAFLAFSLADDGLADLAFRDAPLVASLPFTVTDAGIFGAVVTAAGPNVTAALHDVPVGFVDVAAHAPTTLRLTVADGASAAVEDGGDRIVLARGIEVAVWTRGGTLALAEDARTVTADLAPGDHLLLRVRPVGTQFPALSAHEPAISRAVEAGAVGAEAFVQGGPRAGSAVAAYAPLDVLVRQADGVELTVGADAATAGDARVLIVRADGAALPGRGQVGVRVDGETAPMVETVDALLEGDGPAAFSAEIAGAHVVLVHLPSFSVHEVLVQRAVQFVAEHPEVAVATVIVGGIVVALAAVGMFRPGKGKKLV